MASNTAEAALAARDDLTDFEGNQRTLFALQIEFGIEDLVAVASDAVVDGPDDKSVDVVYVDDATGRAVIAQGYEAAKSKSEAPATKAAGLAQGVQWLVSVPMAKVPERLKSAAQLLRQGLDDGSIGAVDLWYVHNCQESTNVENELSVVGSTLNDILTVRYPDSEIDVNHREVGASTLEEFYRSTQVAIDVTESLTVSVFGAFEESGDQWSSICASVPADWIVGLFEQYEESLFSANVRGYLGSRKSDRNINNGIKETARDNPQDFWVFNNGITALVNDFSAKDVYRNGKYVRTDLELSGIAIVNGAQTTGSLASSEADLTSVSIMARFVKCTSSETIRRIIRFNNRQNKVEAVDFRSNDSVQVRLRSEFEALGSLSYSGGRRGGIDDIIRRPGELDLPATTASQALAAFHGDPNLAYNRKSEIWDSDQQYGRFVWGATTAAHMLLCYSLVKTIDQHKLKLRKIPEKKRTQPEANQLEYLSQRGATYLLVAAIAAGMESILGRQVESRFDLQFHQVTAIEDAVAAWGPVVEIALSLSGTLLTGTEQGLKKAENVEAVISAFQGQLDAIKQPSKATFEQLAKAIDG